MTHFTVHARTSRRSGGDELDKFRQFSAAGAKIEGHPELDEGDLPTAQWKKG